MTEINTAVAATILSRSFEKQADMLSMLKNAIRLESPSQLPNMQRPVFELFTCMLESMEYRCRFLSGNKSGGQMLAIPCNRQKQQPQQLILGHVDTVWPLGTLETMPVESRDGCLHGPGSYDMKAGLVQAVFAVQTLRE
mgnify:FL=1